MICWFFLLSSSGFSGLFCPFHDLAGFFAFGFFHFFWFLRIWFLPISIPSSFSLSSFPGFSQLVSSNLHTIKFFLSSFPGFSWLILLLIIWLVFLHIIWLVFRFVTNLGRYRFTFCFFLSSSLSQHHCFFPYFLQSGGMFCQSFPVLPIFSWSATGPSPMITYLLSCFPWDPLLSMVYRFSKCFFTLSMKPEFAHGLYRFTIVFFPNLLSSQQLARPPTDRTTCSVKPLKCERIGTGLPSLFSYLCFLDFPFAIHSSSGHLNRWPSGQWIWPPTPRPGRIVGRAL